MNAPTGVRRQHKLRQLPRRVCPVQDETTHSYIRRLADANHLPTPDLISHLSPLGAGRVRRRSEVPVDDLAIVSGIAPVRLAYALPEIRGQFADQSALRILGRPTVGYPNRTCPPCRRCMAAKGINGPVTVWARQDRNVCLHHQLWIGRGVHTPGDQLDLSDLPQIAQAQTRHRNLIRRHGHHPAEVFYENAREIIDWSSNHPNSDTARTSRLRYLFDREQTQRLPRSYDYAAYYPEVAGVLSVLVSPFWQHLAISEDPTQQEAFFRQVAANGLTNGAPWRNTPLRNWIDRLRWDRATGESITRGNMTGSDAVEPPDTEHGQTQTWPTMPEKTRTNDSHPIWATAAQRQSDGS